LKEQWVKQQSEIPIIETIRKQHEHYYKSKYNENENLLLRDVGDGHDGHGSDGAEL
jgi:hypothetical protein